MKKIGIYLSIAALLLTAGCSDWTQMEPVDQQPVRPSELNPELWAEYTAALRAYKAGSHTLVVASFENGSTTPTSEKDCLRSLPDSLDAVSLTNADNFSAYDAEDLAVLKEKGTRVLYFVDYAARSGEWKDLAELTDYLDGDRYFRIRREGQNLDRARTQFKLVADMEKKWDAMHEAIRRVAGAVRDAEQSKASRDRRGGGEETV